MNRTDIECYRINYNVDGWREVAHRNGELCVPFAAVLAINALCDEVESLRKDAERYRYLRSESRRAALDLNGPAAGCWIDCEDEAHSLILLTGEDADEAIDNAMETMNEDR